MRPLNDPAGDRHQMLATESNVLETTLAGDFMPASNLKGHVPGANWTFLLPRLHFARIVWIGSPTTAAIETLARVGRQVVVVGMGGRHPARLARFVRSRELTHVHVVRAASGVVPLVSGAVDLMVLDGHAVGGVRGDECIRVLTRDGLVYSVDGPEVRAHGDLATRQRFRLTPVAGEMKTAAPAADQRTIDYLLANRHYGRSVRLRVFKRMERVLNRSLAALWHRRSALAGRAHAGLDDGPPRYVREIAEQWGVRIDACRWGLAALGEYTSRKVLLLLFAQQASAPTYVVKMTRNHTLNWRLKNEASALEQLHAMGVGDVDRVPRTAFAGMHGGLMIVGETFVPGAPFELRSDGTATCGYLNSALEWLVRLAERTRRDPQAPGEVAGSLRTLFERFLHVYRLSPFQEQFVWQQIDRIAGGCPTVFQHGDPGTWNLVATPDGHVGFLDWEAFESRGVPLWDLFYLARAYVAWSSRRRGIRSTPASFSRQMTLASAFGRLLADSSRTYCARARLEPSLVEPLFYTCWMHRALKEAARLAASRTDDGYFVRLLRRCIDERDALREVLSGTP
jgi:phosphotransferase family enzyme